MPDVLPHDAVTAARGLAPHIRAVRDEIEAMRRIPPALAEAIARAGLFQRYLPRSMGDPEIAPLTAFGVIEELSMIALP
jgi:alkylation response protein AidB-like acyl-CoA dehydrogenase